MTFATGLLLPALAVLFGMLVCLELGRRLGARRAAAKGDEADVAAGTVDAAIFALFGLLVAFTFSSAAGRFDQRRGQIIDEANAIGTAYLRIDLLPMDAQAPLRSLFRDYLESRLATFRELPDLEAAQARHARSAALQGEIWGRAVPAARATGNPAVLSLVVSSLNEMFDIASARVATARLHLPPVILGLLYTLALVAALVVGFETAASPRERWFRMFLFAVVIACSIYVILDLEYPRLGLIRTDAADRFLEEVLEQMR